MSIPAMDVEVCRSLPAMNVLSEGVHAYHEYTAVTCECDTLLGIFSGGGRA